jgi:glutamyl-tRNA reductase
VSIVVIGVNHRTGPLALLERVTVGADALPKAVHGLVSRENVREAVVLSTCNRTEVYAVAERFHGAYADIRDFFCELGDLAADDLHPHLYSQHDDAAVTHLFEVAAGLDSAVLGESEILGQVRSAWQQAQTHGGAGATLNLLFRHALETGKRVRTETTIGRGTASISHAAVEMVVERLGTVHGRRVAVVGAGDIGAGVAVALAEAGADDLVVVNRTPSRGRRLAERVGGRLAPLRDLDALLGSVDVVVTCTGAGALLVTPDAVAAVRPSGAAPLLVIDLAVPRDVHHGVGELDGVTLLDLDDLRDWAARGIELRAAESARAREVVADEVERYLLDATARQAAPLVAQLHERVESIRRAEMGRFEGRLGDLTPEQRAAIDALTKGLVAKVLHEPSVRLKDDVGTPRGERNAAAVRDLFDLD